MHFTLTDERNKRNIFSIDLFGECRTAKCFIASQTHEIDRKKSDLNKIIVIVHVCCSGVSLIGRKATQEMHLWTADRKQSNVSMGRLRANTDR